MNQERVDALLEKKRTSILKRVAQLLQESGLTQRALARQMGKKESYISLLMNGNTALSLNTICELEITLDRPIINVRLAIPELHTDAGYAMPTDEEYIRIAENYLLAA